MTEPTAADRERAERVLSGIVEYIAGRGKRTTLSALDNEFAAARVSGDGEVDRLMRDERWNIDWCIDLDDYGFKYQELRFCVVQFKRVCGEIDRKVIATGPTAIEAIRAALAITGETK